MSCPFRQTYFVRGPTRSGRIHLSIFPLFVGLSLLLTDLRLDPCRFSDGWLHPLFKLLDHNRWAGKIGLGLRSDYITDLDSFAVRQRKDRFFDRYPYK